MVPITFLVVKTNNKLRPDSQMQFPGDKCTPIMILSDFVLSILALNTGLFGIFAGANAIPNTISYTLIGVGSFITLSWITLVIIKSKPNRYDYYEGQ